MSFNINMDIIQLFLVVSLILLTALLVFLGIQVYFVLQEVRVTLRILQKTLHNAEEISDLVKNPVASLTKIQSWGTVVSGLREGIKMYKSFKSRPEDE